jgi:hypothetical protein
MPSRLWRLLARAAVIAALAAAFAIGWIFRAELEPLLTAEHWLKLAGRSDNRAAAAPLTDPDVPESDAASSASVPNDPTTAAAPAGANSRTEEGATASVEKPAPPSSVPTPAVASAQPAADLPSSQPTPPPEIRTDLDASLSLPEPGLAMEVRKPGEGLSSATGADSLIAALRPDGNPPAAPEGAMPPDAGTLGESSLLSGEAASIPPTAPATVDNSTLSDPSTLDAEVIKAQSAVEALITASDVDTVVPLIFAGEDFREALKSYHETRPLRPLRDAVIERQFDGKVPETGARAFIFSVVHPSHPRGFPVSAEATPDGYKIDWESYIQWRDEWLRGFIENRPQGPFPLFVVLRRTHYFNDDVPQLDGKLAFKVASAVPGDAGTTVFVEKASPTGRSLAETYEWGKIYFPVVELEWRSENGAGPFVRLNRVLRPTWRRAVTH